MSQILLLLKTKLCSVAPPFPQLSVLFLLTNRTNEATLTHTPRSLSSIYHLLSIASLYLLVFSSLHLQPPPPQSSLPPKLFIYEHHFRLFYSSPHKRRMEEVKNGKIKDERIDEDGE